LEKNVQKKHSHRVRLGFIGQVLPRKGVHVFLRAFGMYDWRGEAELHLYGDAMVKPEYWQELQNIEYSNPDAVYFHGVFPHQNLGKIFANLDVLVVPSLWHENNPRVIQEAFACGTPVIASNVGGIVEYVQHNVNGLLFQRGDSDDLRFQMNRVVKEPALLTRLRSHIPKVKSIGEEVKEFEMIYRELLSQEEVAV
jgi:glycosyltransferase involved in cell wall biosynthesis